MERNNLNWQKKVIFKNKRFAIWTNDKKWYEFDTGNYVVVENKKLIKELNKLLAIEEL